jgi:adenylosuccinate synthase
MINGVTKLVMTKADVLDSFSTLSVCTAYKVGGVETCEMPYQLERSQPEAVLQQFSGWNTATDQCKSYESLPDSMKQYVNFINGYLGVNVRYISNGPGRDQLVVVP